MRDKPLDARLACVLIRPLADIGVHPNHLTLLRLLTGLLAVAALTVGDYAWSNAGALLFVLSNLLDHGDGELARMTRQQSRLGHMLDLTSDAVIHTLIFVALGLSEFLQDGALADLTMGLLAGLSVSGIFHLRYVIERQHGKAAVRQPGLAWFEVEDIIYLFPLVTLFQVEYDFLLIAAIGAPITLLGVLGQYYQLFHHRQSRPS